MTIWQILALAICAPLSILSLASLIGILIFKERSKYRNWGLFEALLLVIPAILIALSFVGVK